MSVPDVICDRAHLVGFQDSLTTHSCTSLRCGLHHQRRISSTDFRDVGGGGFNLLFEIQSPDEASWWGSKKPSPDIILEGDNGIKAEMHYSKSVAWANGDGTRHATNIVNHRPHRGVRISCTIFINDISKDNIDNLSYGVSLPCGHEFVRVARMLLMQF